MSENLINNKKLAVIGCSGLVGSSIVRCALEKGYEVNGTMRNIEDSTKIKYLKKLKIKVSGPYPADTIFLKENSKKFNIIVGMYHDQVLTPLKTLFEYDAINITVGLPFLRVSPDHGPNEKMLGKNKSNPLSLIKAISFLDKNRLKQRKA